MSQLLQDFVNPLISKFVRTSIHTTIVSFNILSFIIAYVSADECSESCAYIHPYTVPYYDRSCITTGFSANYTPRVMWDDGEFSDISIDFVAQLAIGSCCSAFSLSDYGSGVVTCGKFKGESVNVVFTLSDKRDLPSKCETRGGLTRLVGEALLAIGTKGVGEWIECNGNVSILYSPALTSIPQSVVYATLSVEFGVCTECIESCT